jgi:hypothetical protein
MSWKKRRRRSGDTLCLAYTVALPRTASTEAGEAGDLPERSLDGPCPAAMDECRPRLGPGPCRYMGAPGMARGVPSDAGGGDPVAGCGRRPWSASDTRRSGRASGWRRHGRGGRVTGARAVVPTGSGSWTTRRARPAGRRGASPAASPGHAGTKHRPRRGSWFVCRRCGTNGDRDDMAAWNIGAQWFAEQQARRAEAGQGKRGRALAEAAAAHRQGVSYMGASVAKSAGTPAHEPFAPQNAWIPILSRRANAQAGARKTVRTAKGWVYRARRLCGWRGRHVRVTPKPCPAWVPAA